MNLLRSTYVIIIKKKKKEPCSVVVFPFDENIELNQLLLALEPGRFEGFCKSRAGILGEFCKSRAGILEGFCGISCLLSPPKQLNKLKPFPVKMNEIIRVI